MANVGAGAHTAHVSRGCSERSAKLARRRAHDATALAKATPGAKRAAVDLLQALLAKEPPAVIRDRAAKALHDISLLWEAAAHLTAQ